MWKKMSAFDPDGSFFHWACGIAFDEVRNFLTVQRRSRLQFDLELVELLVETVDSARILAGTVFIDVTEVSNGFLLETPEAQIMDEGTQYAVLMDSLATEVHVFDGREAAIKVSPLTVLVRSVLEWTLPIERPQALHQHSPRGWARSLTMESVFWLTVGVVSGAKHSSLAAFVADQAKSEPTILAL